MISLAKVAEYARWRRRPVGELPELPDVDEDAARATSCATVLADAPAGRDLTDDELIALLAAYGVPLLGTRTVTDADAAVAAADGGRLPGRAEVDGAVAAAPLRPGRRPARPGRRRRGARPRSPRSPPATR